MNQWKPYLIAVAVGLLVGIERENSKADQKALGVRTFLLISLLGSIAGGLQTPWQSTAISVFALGLIFTSYFIQIFSKTNEIHLGLTTEFAAGIVYVAGFISHHSPILAATTGPVVALVLFSKASLHRFTQALKPVELKTAITILLIAAVVIDLFPDANVDPWGFFNPRRFGYLVLTLACLEFLSYIAYKFIGEKKSSLVIGLLGGLVSSTAVLLSSARSSKIADDSWRNKAITVIAAQLSSLIELLLIVFLVSPVLCVQVSFSVAPLVLFGGSALFVLNKKIVGQISEPIVLKSPLQWKGVFRLSVIFTFFLVLVSVAEKWLGTDATMALSFLTGLFELQGISLANASLFVQNQVSLQHANEFISVAIIASLISKLALSWFIGRNKFSICLSVVFVPMIALVLLITAWISYLK